MSECTDLRLQVALINAVLFSSLYRSFSLDPEFQCLTKTGGYRRRDSLSITGVPVRAFWDRMGTVDSW